VVLAVGVLYAEAETYPASAAAGTVMLEGPDLEQLVAPIALYPDPLLAQMLPASTYPLEIRSAARWLLAHPNASEEAIDGLAMEPAVKALLHYPAVLLMMNHWIDWTRRLGVAFLNQQEDVMGSIQRLRAAALNAGTLKRYLGPEQQVIMDEDGIELLPADDNVLYVPEYDSDMAYTGSCGDACLIYRIGYLCGVWLNNIIDWHNHRVGVGGGWNHGWRPIGEGRPRTHEPWHRDRNEPLPVLLARTEEPGRIRLSGGDVKAARPSSGAFRGNQKFADVQRSLGREWGRPAVTQFSREPGPRPWTAASAERMSPSRSWNWSLPSFVFGGQLDGLARVARSFGGHSLGGGSDGRERGEGRRK
jgi:hypothetical protein